MDPTPYVDRAFNIGLGIWAALTLTLGGLLWWWFGLVIAVLCTITWLLLTFKPVLTIITAATITSWQRDLPRLYEESGQTFGSIHEVSETIIGRYMDVDIPEWVETESPKTKQVERYFFESVVQVDSDGDPILPSSEDRERILASGFIYGRDLQPAQG